MATGAMVGEVRRGAMEGAFSISSVGRPKSSESNGDRRNWKMGWHIGHPLRPARRGGLYGWMSSKLAPAKPGKTKTQPDSERYFFEGPDPVTWIHIRGTVHHFELPRQLVTITLGSAESCDIVVPSQYVSRHHLTIERRHGGIRIHDHSKNGTYIDARRIGDDRDIRAGQGFSAGAASFIALNDEMARQYALLSDLIDWETSTELESQSSRFATPCDAIEIASGVDHLMIAGDVGCGQAQLAEAIHAMSPLRGRPLVRVDSIPVDRGAQKELLARAARATMVLAIGDEMPVMDDAFRSSLFALSYRIRLIVLAWPRRARAVLGEDRSNMQRLDLRPIAYREHVQIERLLDRQLEARGCALRLAHMTETNRSALLRYSWPRNFDDLKLAADRLAAIARAGSLRKAAAALDEHASKVQHWFTNQLGLELPLNAAG
ncbi:MAG: FHA domain-containing protein [Deltaproteobacteria bacterium]|nr:FHA domain-containing protein [Deltaproteobacteria bacterium]